MLIILDNARDTGQIRPLLPGSPTCRVIVTSRNELPGLIAVEATRPLAVPPLTDAEARQLLARRLCPAAIDRHPAAVAELISSCAGLPLALCIVAARAELRPDLSLDRLAADLASRPVLDTFGGLADPAADIRASFWWSCRQLDGLAARAFRLAGLHPGASIEPAAIVALAEVTPALARRALETLARASLIQTRGHERYSMNTLLRAYAAEQAARHQEQAPP
jgi:NB-ARC domain